MTWHKTDCRLQCSPRLRAVANQFGLDRGQLATLVWLAVLAVNAEHDCDGTIPPMVADWGYLATFCPMVPTDEVRPLVDLLAAVGLLELLPDGGVHILGWDATWRAVKPSTARVQLHRQAKAARKAQDGGK